MRAACPEAQLADADWAELRAAAAATSFDRHQLNARLKDLGIAKLGHRLMILNQLRALGDEAAAGPLGSSNITEALGDTAAAFEARGDEATAVALWEKLADYVIMDQAVQGFSWNSTTRPTESDTLSTDL